ncbi:hypothetical protein [Pelagibacterium sediminicola]|uniref:hypothetical protein n=1 Tax=Pelagibacterium sediminicola TaxID=2248761 RepID=UPI000E320E7B|nr:hypothetical protein [Pelagibacterium sediminicola]
MKMLLPPVLFFDTAAPVGENLNWQVLRQDDDLEMVQIMLVARRLKAALFKITDGRQPDPEWDAGLEQTPSYFYKLKECAGTRFGTARHGEPHETLRDRWTCRTDARSCTRPFRPGAA